MPDYKGKNSTLTIDPTPFKSSLLAIPPSPFSPRTPLTIQVTVDFSTRAQASVVYTTSGIAAPSSPLSWIWQCHKCHRSYQLGVTRRCLDDGHHFCSGTTTVKSYRKGNLPKRKRHKACASEFDYQGWKAWGRWKRAGGRNKLQYPKVELATSPSGKYAQVKSAKSKKDCWNTCDYPSECRWGKSFGIHTPLEQEFPIIELASEHTVLQKSPEHTEEGVLKPENCSQLSTKKSDRADLWTALVASAKRRKNNVQSSPLATIADEEPEALLDVGSTPESNPPEKNLITKTIDPALLIRPAELFLPILSDLKPLIVDTTNQAGQVHSGDVLGELAQLERVSSRDSGYQSAVDAV